MKLKAHVLFALADASDPPPIQTDLQLTWRVRPITSQQQCICTVIVQI